ncbi:MAG: hypothetical protein U1F52_08750 [Burkholderiales bacterium]
MTTTPEQKKRLLGRIGLLVGLAAMATVIGAVLWYMAIARQTSTLTAEIETSEARVTTLTKDCAAKTAADQAALASSELKAQDVIATGPCAAVAQARQEHEALTAQRTAAIPHARLALGTIALAGIIAIAAWFFALR